MPRTRSMPRGNIGVHSVVGQGSTFWVELALAD